MSALLRRSLFLMLLSVAAWLAAVAGCPGPARRTRAESALPPAATPSAGHDQWRGLGRAPKPGFESGG